MTSIRSAMVLAFLAASPTLASAHVGDHAGSGVMHVLGEHGYLIAMAAIAVAAAALFVAKNRSTKL
jgi:phosphopantothenate synthetase